MGSEGGLFPTECTKVIMEDALIRKQGWTKKLDDLKVEGLLALRDIVMATSIEHMMDKDDCNMNLDVIKSTVRSQPTHTTNKKSLL